MQNTTIFSAQELAVATRTNTPDIFAPQEYQNKITEVAKKYLNNYMLRYTDKDVVGLSDLLPIVRNRFENLTVEGIQNGTINNVSDLNNLLRGNAMLEALEEKAIIEAFHNGVLPEATLYVQIFFTYKTIDFMRQTNLLLNDNAQDIFSSLQAYLYELVDDFDFDKIAHGGLPKKYYCQKMYDYYRDKIVKQTSLLSYNRRQAYDLSKARKITESDSRTKTLTQLSQEYDIPKSAIITYFMISNPVYLDVEHARDDGETVSIHESIEDTRDEFDGIEKSECMKQMMSELDEQLNIQRSTTTAVLAAIISYTYSSAGSTKNGRIKKLSQPAYREIADSLQVPVRTVDAVVNKFVETFAS